MQKFCTKAVFHSGLNLLPCCQTFAFSFCPQRIQITCRRWRHCQFCCNGKVAPPVAATANTAQISDLLWKTQASKAHKCVIKLNPQRNAAFARNFSTNEQAVYLKESWCFSTQEKEQGQEACKSYLRKTV